MKKYVVVLCVMLILGGLGLVLVSGYLNHKKEQTYTYSTKVIGNPLMGYAPQATDEEVSKDVELLYVDVTWAELEPKEGQFQWEAIEKANQFDRWRSEGKHVVFRFILDYPTEEKHKDIPNWLYESLDHPGAWYSTSYGKGFSPNYADKKLQSYYKKAVQAMAQRWGDDGFIAYIELGGVGHWGEWHVNTAEGVPSLPRFAELENFVSPWLTADFTGSQFLMRRPFTTAKKNGLGLYNDMAGSISDTKEWLKWIESGGSYNQTGESVLVAMSDYWQSAPVGGELTSGISMKTLMSTRLSETRKWVRQSHTSFLGPKVAEKNSEGYYQLLSDLGYRLWISKAVLKGYGKQKTLSLTWHNAGQAPFYKDWSVRLQVVDSSGKVLDSAPFSMDLRKILPDQSQTITNELPKSFVTADGNLRGQLRLAIIDPMTDKPAVKLLMEGQESSREISLF
ncbi:DUF4832 domain-containing protein [Streptococcus saliviloxodontae]|uniref:DUF4832 domain-containing protein n=1 Tax=Streptococcus saliviloxodontae TaxID=1349416 RepID=A0ABS2PLA4_9STRE|nr:DUF4832 domain-containing protein [Streptococcus saliviloxodontae]MBM7635770.1 hypothetical protein [Streptococcus saliviloxodontae]